MPTISPTIKKATPVLVVDQVEPCAAFWEKLGFTRTAEVPHEDTLGFVILTSDGVELMYQSVESVRADNAAMGESVAGGGSRVALFVEVTDLDAAARAITGAPVFMERRETFYGMTEIGVRDPGGHAIILAQPTKS
ncbi:MAG TPA: VOC family protein [Gemmatimonadaceae bacterium]|nr:VOC family protein [Gemmatimonadaceae bacterium]